MRHDQLVTVSSTLVLSQAEALRKFLRTHGIPCTLGGIFRARAPGFPIMDVQIQVPAASAADARRLLERRDTAPATAGLSLPPTAQVENGPERNSRATL
jgi:hypothetical protein